MFNEGRGANSRPLPASGQVQALSRTSAAQPLYGFTGARCECRFNIRIEAPVRDPRPPESPSAMSALRLISSQELIELAPVTERRGVPEPERGLNSFVNSMASLIVPGVSGSLSDLWLDELACMECIPGSESFNWRSVSLSASVKLASRVIASKLSGPCILNVYDGKRFSWPLLRLRPGLAGN